ncbi:tRNA lysidine(34) synthetase TilS [Methylobacillus arboreus]|uniref:tRNA lysidine(34) synthetase TilS n=1 Tax=Methylobacillus arboreus TaxID=755170 RepID=UPI001E3AA75C|nr:tRNA lysidine(34) synthetase TilS [Methylobacillus arboreus]MCB5190004.1 tRNA lysidine(34) synthetase TilS [Methylobacillus arboreus]
MSRHVSGLVRRTDNFLSSHIKPGQRLLVAFSGGLDSRVLLQLLAEARSSHSFVLEAMHVHHGLSPNADAWAEFCADECRRLDVPFHCERVDVDTQSGLGIEASARQARYAALLSRQADHVVLAHHQDDQAETLLLQLLRGAGAKGLAGMATLDRGRCLLRPLMDASRAELEAFARQAGLNWIEDESNLDTAYDRNFCRHQVFPLIEQRFPAAKSTFARSATHIAEALGLLDELAVLDAAAVVVAGRLNVATLGKLSDTRARNLLRWWLAAYGLPMPGQPRLQEMLQQLLHAGDKAMVKVQAHEATYVRRYQGWACLSLEWPIPEPGSLSWQGESELLLPNNGHLFFERKTGAGLALARIQGRGFNIRYRSGGERFKPDAKRPTRTLKQLSQEASLAPWLRERLPLLYLEEELVLVPGLGVASHWKAQAGEEGVLAEWQPLTLSRLAGFE